MLPDAMPHKHTGAGFQQPCSTGAYWASSWLHHMRMIAKHCRLQHVQYMHGLWQTLALLLPTGVLLLCCPVVVYVHVLFLRAPWML